LSSGISNASSAGSTKRVEGAKEKSQDRLSECISENHELSVLFLVDESKSLRDTSTSKGTDPENRRVDGIKAAISGLAASASIDERTKINVRFLGFGNSVEKRSDWIEIENTEKLDAVASEFEKFNNSTHTDYISGLEGSLNTLIERSTEIGRPNCKLLVWLTDGGYNTDGSIKLSPAELGELNNRLCNEGGIADQLRQIGATVVAIGLSNNNQTDFSWLQKVVGEIPGCGKLEPNGWFIPVVNANALVDELFKGVSDPTAGPKTLGRAQVCTDKPVDCAEIAFDVSELVTTFQILVQPNFTDVSGSGNSGSVSMIAPGNIPRVTVLPVSSDNDLIQVKKLNESRALVRVDFTQESPKDRVGRWRIRFEGPGAEESQALAVFLSDYKAELAPDQEPVIDRAKSETKPLNFILKSSVVPTSEGTDLTVIPKLTAVLKLQVPIELNVLSKPGMNYEISAEQIQPLFDDPRSELSLASDITIELTPQILLNGMAISFSPQRIIFSLRDGDKYPSVSVIGHPTIDQDKTAIVHLLLKGPQQGAGIATVGSQVTSVEDAPDGITAEDFSITGVNPKCVVLEESKSDDCIFEISANFQSNSELILIVPVSIGPRLPNISEGPKQINLRIHVMMTKPINKAVTIWAGLGLLLLFAMVQLLLRFGFAVAMSRFEPLPAGSRRVTKSIKISNSGQLGNSDGGAFSIRNEDTEFVFDMDKPFRKLVIDGFEFSISRMKTFITQRPLGTVSSQDENVFGSLGRSVSNDRGIGAVALAPRKQWAIAVTDGNLALLANGEPTVDARMIVFFDDLTRSSLDQQLSELTDRVTTSSLASDLVTSLDRFREVQNGKRAGDVNGEKEKENLPGGRSKSDPLLDSNIVKVDTNIVTPDEPFFDPNDPLS
jgi:hypothetical protein